MNVLEAAKERIKYTFENFDNIYVSFSGGKDSGVMLNLVIDHMRENNITKKIGVFHIDYEAQYQMTTDYSLEELSKNKDIIDVYHICLPLSVSCATSMHQGYWIPWDEDKKELWVRDIPETATTENNNKFDFFTKGMWDYDFQEKFSKWYHESKGAKKTACLVGIRTDESMNRWRAIHSDKNYHKFNGKRWTKKMIDNVYNIYPIYDWKAKDVWTANYKYEWDYNKLYDLFHQAGLTLDQMRCASPFNDQAVESLKYYKAIDPKTWGKMIGRVNGVNFSGIYGGTTAMGWKSIKLPKGHTWKSYLDFLLSTLPKEAAENYKKKLDVSIKFWKERGGCLSEETIIELIDSGIDIEIGEKTNYRTEKYSVTMDYQDDVPVSDFKSIPSYKRMCVCVMKNDHLCKYMGFSLNKTETEKRKIAEAKFKENK